MIPTRDEIERWIMTMRTEIDRLQADLDRANTTLFCKGCGGTVSDHLAPDQGGCPGSFDIGGVPMVPLAGRDAMQKRAEKAEADLALAKATTPAPEREAAIRAWEKEALECCDASDDTLYFVTRDEITAAVALMRSAGDGKALLRELRALARNMFWNYALERWNIGTGAVGTVVQMIDEMLAQPAPVEQPAATASRFDERASELRAMLSWVEYQPCLRNTIAGEEVRTYLTAKIKELDEQAGSPVEQPAAAVTDHFPDAGKMVPVLYWLEDGKFARAMLVGKDLLVVDLTFGDGPSVVGKPDWFLAGYVAAYGGLVPESATRGKEPGQWDYGVASIAKPAAAVPDDCGLGQITAEMVQAGIAAVKDGRWITLEQLRKELAPVPDDPRWQLVAQLADAVVTLCDGQGFGVTLSEVQAIAKQLRGGA